MKEFAKSARTLLWILALAVPLSAQDLKEEVSHAALYTMTGADLGTTWYGITKDNRREANPLLPRRLAAQGAVILGMTAAADWQIHKVRRAGHPKLAFWLRMGLAGAHGYAVWRNLK